MQGTNAPLSTAEAVELTGEKNVTQFLRVMKRHNIEPVLQLRGIRGAKFWDADDLLGYPFTSPVVTPSAPEADRLAAGDFSSSSPPDQLREAS